MNLLSIVSMLMPQTGNAAPSIEGAPSAEPSFDQALEAAMGLPAADLPVIQAGTKASEAQSEAAVPGEDSGDAEQSPPDAPLPAVALAIAGAAPDVEEAANTASTTAASDEVLAAAEAGQSGHLQQAPPSDNRAAVADAEQVMAAPDTTTPAGAGNPAAGGPLKSATSASSTAEAAARVVPAQPQPAQSAAEQPLVQGPQARPEPAGPSASPGADTPVAEVSSTTGQAGNGYGTVSTSAVKTYTASGTNAAAGTSAVAPTEAFAAEAAGSNPPARDMDPAASGPSAATNSMAADSASAEPSSTTQPVTPEPTASPERPGNPATRPSAAAPADPAQGQHAVAPASPAQADRPAPAQAATPERGFITQPAADTASAAGHQAAGEIRTSAETGSGNHNADQDAGRRGGSTATAAGEVPSVPSASDLRQLYMEAVLPEALEEEPLLPPEPVPTETAAEADAASSRPSRLLGEAVFDPTRIGGPAGASSASDLPPVDTARSLDQVARAIELSVRRETTDLRVRLDPPDLGALHVKVSMAGGEVTAQIRAESETIHRMIFNHQADLRETLQQAGIRLDQIQVPEFDMGWESSPQHGQDHRESHQPRSGQVPHTQPAPAAAQASVHETLAAAQGLMDSFA